jgi:hypothetical protein
MIVDAIEVEGTLGPDGNLILDEKPALPPGRVRVALRSLPKVAQPDERLPDEPWEDNSISAPCDLPYSSPVTRVTPHVVVERLPELAAELAEPGG